MLIFAAEFKNIIVMRIIKYKNEKKCTCDNCGTVFAYNPDVDINSDNIKHSDFVSKISDFTKSLTMDESKQFSQKQLRVMKEHPDWVMYLCSSHMTLDCPVCNKKIHLDEKFDYMEIYPEQKSLPEDSEPNNIISWDFD